jgi:hypothetical protein
MRSIRAIAAGAVLGAALLVSTGAAWAATSPNGPGQPGAPSTTCFTSKSTANAPANSVTTNNSSVFNGSGQASAVYAGNLGTASAANANSPHAVSQYDIACFQVTSNH